MADEARRLLHRGPSDVEDPELAPRALGLGSGRRLWKVAGSVAVLGAVAAVAVAGTRSSPRRPARAGKDYVSLNAYSCVNGLESLQIGSGNGQYFRCADPGYEGYCVDQCDGQSDCPGGGDEQGCPGGQPAAQPAYAAPQQAAYAAPQQAAYPGGGGGCTEKAGLPYALNWKAEGSTFFDEFNFQTNDPNAGSAEYLDKPNAFAKGVVSASPGSAILKAGPKGTQPLKRMSAKVRSQRKWKYFLLALKFNHVPWGCGVWPAIWTTSPDAGWPNGGELDILEYCNEETSRSSFHVGQANRCALDQRELRKAGCPQFVDAEYNFTGHYDCVTNYPEHIGCAPNRLPLMTGEQLASAPGVVAAEWTQNYLKLFYIPANAIPEDLAMDRPQPDSWEQFVFAYYPFAASNANIPGSCPDPANVMKAQQLVLSLGFCGDWASKIWVNSTCANNMGATDPNSFGPKGSQIGSQCLAVDPHNPMGQQPGGPMDCCTQYIYDENDQFGTEQYLAQNAYFDIEWLKVYQQTR